MASTLKASCPGCRTKLRIPADWVGQTLRCKNCGMVLKSAAKASGEGELAASDETGRNVPVAAEDTGPVQAFDLDSLAEPSFDPTVGYQDPSAVAPPAAQQPAYPAPPPGYAPHPGYGYPAAPGYPYPVAPGYPYPPAGYGPPPGYPYPGFPQPYGAPGYPPAGYAPGMPYPGAPVGMPPGGYAPPQPGYQPPAPPQPVAYQSPQPVPVTEQTPPPQSAGSGVAIPPGAPKTSKTSRSNPSTGAEGAATGVPALTDDPFSASDATRSYKGRGKRYDRGGDNPNKKWVMVGGAAGVVVLLLIVAMVASKKRSPAPEVADGKETQASRPTAKEDPKKGAPAAPAGPAFPRRMMFVSVSNYLYLNPLTVDESGRSDQIRTVANRLAFEWRVPNEKEQSQVFVISDTDPGRDSRPPVRNVLQGAYEQFFATSRPQDRILFYFGGHAVEIEGKVFLVPVEGDLEEPETLIPLDDFWAKLTASPAQQKVVMWDVCRFNPQRGRQRPGSEPMSEKLSQALHAAPPGVQVWTACSPGENALEFFANRVDGSFVKGTSLLDAVQYTIVKGRAAAFKTTAPTEPIPAAGWAEAVAKRVAAVAADNGMKQTPKFTGELKPEEVAYNPTEPLAKRIALPEPPRGVSPEQVSAIVQEFTLPALIPDVLKPNADGMGAKDELSGLVPYTEAQLKDYLSDVTVEDIRKSPDKYPLRIATLDAYAIINKEWAKSSDGSTGIQAELTGPIDENKKKQWKDYQVFPAIAIAELEEAKLKLELAGETRAKEPSKRWQAHYDYALAQIKARLAFMHEYDLLLGNILTDSLPPLDEKKGQTGWRLAAAEKMKSKKEIKELAEEAKEGFEKIIADYKKTPWAMQAKRERNVVLGLQWQPYGGTELPGGEMPKN